MQDVVVFDEIECAQGFKIGRARLNTESSLNALSLDMIRLLYPQLIRWQDNDAIVAVMLVGSGEKAFCAGGDIVAMHQAMVDYPGETPPYLVDFFSQEYQLDHFIHCYDKPFIVWGTGIVMGGGMGLFAGASHNIVTNTTRLAMPEVSIGLYPDVAASWFLDKMPGKAGEFLGLTGMAFNAADAVYLGLAKVAMEQNQFTVFMQALAELKWSSDTQNNHILLDQLCLSMALNLDKMAESPMALHQTEIDELLSNNSANQKINGLLAHSAQDKWMEKALSGLKYGSMLTAHIVCEQLRRSEGMALADCFKMELDISCRCAGFGEFQEGIRALLIDKDRQPKWRFAKPEDVPESLIASFFDSPWSEKDHPLSNL